MAFVKTPIDPKGKILDLLISVIYDPSAESERKNEIKVSLNI